MHAPHVHVCVWLCVYVCTYIRTCIDYIQYIYLNAHVLRTFCIHDISFCTDICVIHMVQNVTHL